MTAEKRDFQNEPVSPFHFTSELTETQRVDRSVAAEQLAKCCWKLE
jgi:hypothetical protein